MALNIITGKVSQGQRFAPCGERYGFIIISILLSRVFFEPKKAG
jgi:hypothetical protein